MATRMPRSPHPAHMETAPAGQPQSFLRRQLGLVLGTLAGLAVCGATLLVFSALHASPPVAASVPAPDPAARALCADLQTRNYAALYTLLTPDQQSAGTADQFAASQQELDITSGRVATCSYRIQRVASDAATLAVTIGRGSGSPATGDVKLRYTAGAWRIEAYDATLI